MLIVILFNSNRNYSFYLLILLKINYFFQFFLHFVSLIYSTMRHMNSIHLFFYFHYSKNSYWYSQYLFEPLFCLLMFQCHVNFILSFAYNPKKLLKVFSSAYQVSHKTKWILLTILMWSNLCHAIYDFHHASTTNKYIYCPGMTNLNKSSL